MENNEKLLRLVRKRNEERRDIKSRIKEQQRGGNGFAAWEVLYRLSLLCYMLYWCDLSSEVVAKKDTSRAVFVTSSQQVWVRVNPG